MMRSVFLTPCRRGFALGPDGAADLAVALNSNTTVTTLILWVNKIGDKVTLGNYRSCLLNRLRALQGAVALAPVLASHPKLVKVRHDPAPA